MTTSYLNFYLNFAAVLKTLATSLILSALTWNIGALIHLARSVQY
jgi:hypothetical protein